ncbi:MAG: hypothetical protein Q7S44_01095 [bacterium]|nr:hypothetical protein [bacterium]
MQLELPPPDKGNLETRFQSFLDVWGGQKPRDWECSDIDRISTSALTTFISRRRTIDDPKAFAVASMEAVEAFGLTGEQVVFQLHMSKLRLVNGTMPPVSDTRVQWLLTSEGPLQSIHYDSLNNGNGPNTTLTVGYAPYTHPESVRGGHYKSKSGLLVGPPVNLWPHVLLTEKPKSPPANLLLLRTRGTRPSLTEVVIRCQKMEIEQITLPSKFDFETWVPRLVDQAEDVMVDPKLPWTRWFDELGVQYHHPNKLLAQLTQED